MTGGRAVVEALVAQDVELVFGIPGTHNLEIYRHLDAAPIRHVTPRHEQGGGYAADGYARTTGRPGVCIVTTGPGLTNVATAAATAYADSVPMLVISPGLPRGLDGCDTGYLHEVKAQSRAMDSLVAWSRRVDSASEIVEAVAAAFAHFAAERPRPVHIEVPLDVLEGAATVPEIPVAAGVAPAPERVAVTQAAELLAAAEHPALVLGGGSCGAAQEARKLVELLRLPVVTTVGGKGVVDEGHPLSLGASIRLPRAQELLGRCDVVLAVGTELADSDLWGGRLHFGGKLIRIDIDRVQLDRNAPSDVAVHGDASAALGAIVEALEHRDDPPVRGTTDGARAAGEVRRQLHADALLDGGRFAELHHALGDVLDADAIVAGDSTRACYFGTVHLLPMREPSCFIYPTGYATLGYGLPAAIGAKLGHPDRQVVALMGDGGVMFTLSELATAVELGLAIPLIVINDGGYAQIREEMRERSITPLGVDLRAPDFPALARAFGGAGVTVEDAADLGAELSSALAANVPTLIEMRL